MDSSTPYLQYGIITGIVEKVDICLGKQMLYEVLFTENFEGGKSYRGNTQRSILIPSEWIINISKTRIDYPCYMPEIWNETLTTGIFKPTKKFTEDFKVFTEITKKQ